MKFYYLMTKLNNKSEVFWSQLYQRIEENLYELYSQDFEFIFLKYYKTADVQFSSEMQEKMRKFMEGRLRQFKNSSVLNIFSIYMEEKRLDNYWLENVFIPLFKTTHRKYDPK